MEAGRDNFRRYGPLLAPALCVVLVMVGFALVLLVRASFMPGSGPRPTPGWSLRHYEALFSDPFFVKVLFDTVAASCFVTIVTAVVGFPIAYALARSGERMRRLKLIVLILPLSLSLVVNVFGWMVILGRNGLVNALAVNVGLIDRPAQLLFNWGAVIVVLVHTFLPFQVLSIMGVIVQIDTALEQAAASLRASRWTTFRRVIIPLAMPGVVAGSTIVFMLTISAFVTPRMIGGTRVQMHGSLIYEQMLVVLNWSFAAAMSIVLLILAVGVPALANRLARRGTSRAAQLKPVPT